MSDYPTTPQPGEPGPPPPLPPQGQPYAAPQGQGQPQPAPYAQQAPRIAPDLGLVLLLSIFFGWIPALMLHLTERNNPNPVVRKAATDNLNFQLLRLVVTLVAVIPIIGWILGGIASIVFLIIAIIHAVKVPDEVRSGQYGKFILTPSWVK